MVRLADVLAPELRPKRAKGPRARRVKSDVQATPAFSDLVDETLRKYGKPVAVVNGAVFAVEKAGKGQYILTQHLGYVGHAGSFIIAEDGTPYTIPIEVQRKLSYVKWKGSKNITFYTYKGPLKKPPRVRRGRPIALVPA